jgi:hypothetical protein
MEEPESSGVIQDESVAYSNKPCTVNDFHIIEGKGVGRLPKIAVDRELPVTFIKPFLLVGEEVLYHGVYNTKDRHISTRSGKNQSMGRMFVTNLRLMFWSDDYDRPHLGAFYSDITYWKTSWMPLKSRGVVLIIGGKKVLFAANSNAVETAASCLKKLN